MFLNQWFGLHCRWLFPNYVSIQLKVSQSRGLCQLLLCFCSSLQTSDSAGICPKILFDRNLIKIVKINRFFPAAVNYLQHDTNLGSEVAQFNICWKHVSWSEQLLMIISVSLECQDCVEDSTSSSSSSSFFMFIVTWSREFVTHDW